MIFKKINFILFFLLLVELQAQENTIKHFTVNNGLSSNNVLNIVQDEIGYLWIATNNGLLKFDGANFTEINKLKTTGLNVEKNTIYAGLEKGLSIIENGKSLFFESKKILKTIHINNHIFVATVQGIYKLEKNYLQPLQINTKIDYSIINDIIYINDSFYIATNKGLWSIKNLINPKKSHRIIKDNIVALTKFNNNIIAATLDNGVFIVNEKSVKKNIKTHTNITSTKKLKNEIWVTSKTDGIEIYALPSFSFKHKINKYNSLQTNNINMVYKDKQNTTWIASKNGLYSLTNIRVNNTTKKPQIYFEKSFINHQNIDSILNTTNQLKLSPTENNISIGFKTVDLLQTNKINYRYKLNNTFSTWSTNNNVQLANLNAGNYTLEIQSKVGEKLSNLKSISFIIAKPIYKETWFIMIIIIFTLLLLYFLVDFYIKKNNKKNKNKIDALKLENHLLSLEQKALQLQMNPHFIFNVLNGIKALGNSGKTDKLNKTISQFSVLLRSILSNSRKEEISLKEEINSLKNYIELEQSMSSKTFEYTIKTDLKNIDIEEVLIPTMLIQPFIENAIKHGFQTHKKGKITINFEIKNTFLNCSIIDNGIGIHQSMKQKPNTDHTSVALKVSKERIKNISVKNSFSIDEIIESTNIKGTKVWFKIPLKTDY